MLASKVRFLYLLTQVLQTVDPALPDLCVGRNQVKGLVPVADDDGKTAVLLEPRAHGDRHCETRYPRTSHGRCATQHCSLGESEAVILDNLLNLNVINTET